MDHYDLDYEMAIAFRAEIVARLQKRLKGLQPPPKRNNKPSDRGTDGVS